MLRRHVKSLYFLRHLLLWGMIGFILSICLFMFVRLSLHLIVNQSFSFDQKVIDAFAGYYSPLMDRFMIFMTEIGSAFMLGLLLLLTMIWLAVKRRNIWAMLFSFLAVAGGGLVNLLLKLYFERERPTINQMVEVDGLSFPSGHSMGSMTYFGLLAYFVLRSKRKPLLKAGWSIIFGLVIFMIGISRIYLGVHYPSDVLAGFLAGSVWLILSISLLEFVYLYKEKRHRPMKVDKPKQGSL